MISSPGQGLGHSWKALINTKGTIVSPPHLNIEEHYSDCIIASEKDVEPRMMGIVDRNYRFIVEPKYRVLSARTVAEKTAKSIEQPPRPAFLVGMLGGSSQRIVLSLSGKKLFSLPTDVETIGDLDRGVFKCRIASGDPKISKFAEFDLSGKIVSTSETILAPTHPRPVEIAQNRFIKRTVADTGKFDPLYWKLNHDSPVPRRVMFSRFLKEHNLIGMSKEEVLTLLGSGERIHTSQTSESELSYLLLPWQCVRSALYVKVSFVDGKAQSWCLAHATRDYPAVTENIQLDPIMEAFDKRRPTD